MVDIERKGITLNDWTKGISVDEYAGGSYYYAENIESDYSTKGFRLGKSWSGIILNKRQSGQAVAICPIEPYGNLGSTLFFTQDGSIETDGNYHGYGDYDGDTDGGGALFKRAGNTGYVNGMVYGGYAIGIGQRQVDKIKINLPYLDYDELLARPLLYVTGGTAWTLGTGWEITSDGAQHTTGNTGTLSCSVTIPEDGRYRIAIYLMCDAGRVTISCFGNNFNTQTGVSGRFTFNTGDITAGTYTLTITPTSNFDGYVRIVNVHEFDLSKAEQNKVTITDNSKHPICYWNGDLYIGSGSKIDILNLKLWDVKTKQIIDENFEIVNITQQAGNLIIWATDGYNSKQYYWNGVDASASEIIERRGLKIIGVASTETVSYVLTVSRYVHRVFAVNGYQRSLLSIYQRPDITTPLIKRPYNKYKRFYMDLVDHVNSMTIDGDSLYIPGCMGLYKYGTEVPGLAKSWSRTFWADNNLSNVITGTGNGVHIAYKENGTNYALEKASGPTYSFNGYLVTNPIYWDKIGTRKAIEKLKIGYKNGKLTGGRPIGIKVYAIVDDNYFWRCFVTDVTNRPEVGDIYTVELNTKAKVINVEKTDATSGIITFVTIERKSQSNAVLSQISKVTGDGDSSIKTNNEYDNMCLLKDITNDNVGYYSEFVFGENFVDSYIPYWHKIQFVIELYSDSSQQTPEVYELSMTADIADTTI